MAICVTKLDEIVAEELDKEFMNGESIPEGLDRVFWTGFKEDQATVDIVGQILGRPVDWRSNSTWLYQGIALTCQETGGAVYEGMRFPRGEPITPFPKELGSNDGARAVTRLKAIQGINKFRDVVKKYNEEKLAAFPEKPIEIQ